MRLGLRWFGGLGCLGRGVSPVKGSKKPNEKEIGPARKKNIYAPPRQVEAALRTGNNGRTMGQNRKKNTE